MLLSGQLDAAWICDDPYVQHEDQLALLAVPLYRHEPLYQTYVIVSEGSKAQSFDEIRGTVHAFPTPTARRAFWSRDTFWRSATQRPLSSSAHSFSPMGIETSCGRWRLDWRRAAASMGTFGMSCESVSRN